MRQRRIHGWRSHYYGGVRQTGAFLPQSSWLALPRHRTCALTILFFAIANLRVCKCCSPALAWNKPFKEQCRDGFTIKTPLWELYQPCNFGFYIVGFSLNSIYFKLSMFSYSGEPSFCFIRLRVLCEQFLFMTST